MKYLYIIYVSFLLIFSCKPKQTIVSSKENYTVNDVVIDLVNVEQDRVKVELLPAKIISETAIFYFPKIVPGTYSNDNYGAFIQNVKAYTRDGQVLPIQQLDVNSWEIKEVKKLHKLTYYVNDTFDNEIEHDIFSPSGTNILQEKNYLLNLHGFVGYFNETKEKPYTISILRPKNITSATSHEIVLEENSKLVKSNLESVDVFRYNRYSQVVDDPILYAKQDQESFKVNDIEILLSVYSPNKVHTAKSLLPSMKRMMKAQKDFMGSINSTKKYSIILYLSEYNKVDAQGFGALEHSNSTVVVMPEAYSKEALEQSLIDIVAHEFFHIITPLTIHSKEIHNFDFNNPKMSQHLWMYEGTTEYFAQLFQVRENMISKNEFFRRIVEKIEISYTYNDYLSFTKMSKNILEEPYKRNYNNVYYKGALISMCIDIIIRKQSKGEKGILDLMKSLSKKYGTKQPFMDEVLVEEVTNMTFPEVGNFLRKYVIGTEPINYANFFQDVGLKYEVSTIPTSYFMENEDVSYIDVNKEKNQIIFRSNVVKSSFFKELEIQKGDVLVAVNGKKFDLNNGYLLFELSKKWVKGTPVIMVVNRNGKELYLETTIKEGVTSLQKVLKEVPSKNLTPLQLQTKKSWLG